ncbi:MULTISPECIES: HNH endonuclease [unclassified Bradyrhizobium]|uniref:HNH endonuclease n=1 Tax=unclassified Bradyrhizobium TaxID=2631580 RepID=UPI002915DC66|nr:MULTISPECIES: HNH endonuclease [unclassified Bradyrhizobium]
MSLSAAIITEIEQAAGRNGFPVDPVAHGDWLLLRSPWTRHELLATRNGASFVVATFSPAVAAEAARVFTVWEGECPAGAAQAFAALGSTALHALIGRLYRLALSLPPEPLLEFETRVADLPRSTEADRLVVQRVGQDVFRNSLMEYWGGRCPITGLEQPELLRASHIKPWADCATDAERLDVFNGLLLGAHIDAAFDSALISFTDDGVLIMSGRLTQRSREALGLREDVRLAGLTPRHANYLAWHRRLLTEGT